MKKMLSVTMLMVTLMVSTLAFAEYGYVQVEPGKDNLSFKEGGSVTGISGGAGLYIKKADDGIYYYIDEAADGAKGMQAFVMTKFATKSAFKITWGTSELGDDYRKIRRVSDF